MEQWQKNFIRPSGLPLADLKKLATCHTFRHFFATLLLEGAYDIQFLGHSDVKATMIYTHGFNRSPPGVHGPSEFETINGSQKRIIGLNSIMMHLANN